MIIYTFILFFIIYIIKDMPIEIVHKPVGYTPNQIIKYLQDNQLISKYASAAGRLDPMAKGLLRILTDNDCKDQDKHIKEDKVYEWDLILGIGTDTADILGIPEKDNVFCENFIKNDIIDKLDKQVGTSSIINGIRKQKYPLYSSIYVRTNEYGRNPLWWYAKNNIINNVQIPEKDINIYDFKIISKEIIDLEKLCNIAEDRINALNDDDNSFRQNEILEKWEKLRYAKSKNSDKFLKIKCITHVSSGCYIRKLAEEIAEIYNTKGIALDINRIKIGNIVDETIPRNLYIS